MIGGRYRTFPHRARLYRMEHTSDGGGGYETAPVKIADTDAFFDAVRGRERFQAQQSGLIVDNNVYIPYSRDVANVNELHIEDLDTGDTFRAVSKPIDQGGQREVMQIPSKRGEAF